jgi:hypothetical protein
MWQDPVTSRAAPANSICMREAERKWGNRHDRSTRTCSVLPQHNAMPRTPDAQCRLGEWDHVVVEAQDAAHLPRAAVLPPHMHEAGSRPVEAPSAMK